MFITAVCVLLLSMRMSADIGASRISASVSTPSLSLIWPVTPHKTSWMILFTDRLIWVSLNDLFEKWPKFQLLSAKKYRIFADSWKKKPKENFKLAPEKLLTLILTFRWEITGPKTNWIGNWQPDTHPVGVPAHESIELKLMHAISFICQPDRLMPFWKASSCKLTRCDLFVFFTWKKKSLSQEIFRVSVMLLAFKHVNWVFFAPGRFALLTTTSTLSKQNGFVFSVPIVEMTLYQRRFFTIYSKFLRRSNTDFPCQMKPNQQQVSSVTKWCHTGQP